MKAEITEITPTQAKRMLSGNDHNRPTRRKLIEQYARDMEAGNWHVNGEAIVLNGRTLIDGQHRLMACVKAGVPFKSVVVKGVPLEATYTIDSGAKRTLSDVLKINGEKDAGSIAGAVLAGWKWDNTSMRHGMRGASNAEALAWLDANPEVREGINMVIRLRYNPLRARMSSMALVATKAIQAGLRDEMQAFVDGLATGLDLSSTDPIYHLRNMFINNATAHKKLHPVAVHARIIKAWNAYILGEPMTLLSHRNRKSAKGREEFPVMVDALGRAISRTEDTEES